jgi:hypothetical protein
LKFSSSNSERLVRRSQTGSQLNLNLSVASLERWDRRFESYSRHDCLCLFSRWVDNIEIDLREMGWYGLD